MKQFLRRISPRRAASDLATVWRQPTDHRWPILGLSIAGTFALFMLFIPDSQRIEPVRPEIIYFSTFDESRSIAEIIRSNCENQQRQDELDALYAERAEIRRDVYKALGRAAGMDVDAIEQEAEAEEAQGAGGEAIAANDRVLDPALSFEELCGSAQG